MNTLALIAMALLVVSTSAKHTRHGQPVIYGYTSGKCPAENFYDDCNHCTCRLNGINASCTKIGCLEPLPGTDPSKPLYAPDYKPGNACPAKYFYDGCNTCVCRNDGVTAGCTEMFCLPSKPV